MVKVVICGPDYEDITDKVDAKLVILKVCREKTEASIVSDKVLDFSLIFRKKDDEFPEWINDLIKECTA